jgi:predicted nucleotidyltransferase
MKICAIITEYNPFHNGHLKQIEYIRENLSDTTIVAIMSGNVVQRGELAVYDKYTRAEMALRCGVDAVLELPYPWCGASAGYFAKGGVEIAKAIGADYLCFGSESGDIEELKAVDINTLSPYEAMSFLFNLQKRLK